MNTTDAFLEVLDKIKGIGRFIERTVCFKPMAVIDDPYYAKTRHYVRHSVADEAVRNSIRQFILTDRSLEAV